MSSDAILRYLKTNTFATEHCYRRLNSEIALLREYRTRLIADVVTGKLDVRAAAAALPEEEEAAEAQDEAFEESTEPGADPDAAAEGESDDIIFADT